MPFKGADATFHLSMTGPYAAPPLAKTSVTVTSSPAFDASSCFQAACGMG